MLSKEVVTHWNAFETSGVTPGNPFPADEKVQGYSLFTCVHFLFFIISILIFGVCFHFAPSTSTSLGSNNILGGFHLKGWFERLIDIDFCHNVNSRIKAFNIDKVISFFHL